MTNHPFTTSSPYETESLASELLKKYEHHNVWLLQGNLGTGKTTFVRGIAKALGITQPIKSPTFTYLNSYPLPSTFYPLPSTLYHFDLYRLPENTQDFPELTEALGKKDALIIIEWPERLQTQPSPALHLQFNRNPNNTHTISATTRQ